MFNLYQTARYVGGPLLKVCLSDTQNELTLVGEVSFNFEHYLKTMSDNGDKNNT